MGVLGFVELLVAQLVDAAEGDVGAGWDEDGSGADGGGDVVELGDVDESEALVEGDEDGDHAVVLCLRDELGIGDVDDELIASEAEHDLVVVDFAERLGYFDKYLIACRMAEFVVDGLEVVAVEDKEDGCFVLLE